MVESPYFIQLPGGGFAPAPAPASGGTRFALPTHEDCALCLSRLAVIETNQTAAEKWRAKIETAVDEANAKLDKLLLDKASNDGAVRLAKWGAGMAAGVFAAVLFAIGWIADHAPTFKSLLGRG